MSEVWEAHDTRLNRPVAVKILRQSLAEDPGFLTRFEREAIAAARLSHPNIVAVYDAGAEPSMAGPPRAYIVMELVRGDPLRAMLRKGISLHRAIDIAIQEARGLDHAPRAGLVHRDIKPANILVQPDGLVKVADFGIAKALGGTDHRRAMPEGSGGDKHDGSVEGDDLTQVGAILGTAKYVSPEQVTGRPVDARSDLYSLGVVLYEMVCGRPPYVGKTDLATATLHSDGGALRPRQIRPGIPRGVDDVVMRAMAVRPEDRYPSAAALIEALRRLDVDADDAAPAVVRSGPDHTPARGTPRSGDRTQIDGPRTTRRPANSGRPRSRHILPALVLTVLIGVGAGSAAGWFVAKPTVGHDVNIVGVQSFDPFGTGPRGENDNALANLHDGDPNTSWATETYKQGLTKQGVGVVLELAQTVAIHRLWITTGNRGWSVQVFVAPGPHATLAQWGAPVAELNHLRDTAKLDLRDRTGRFILIWITDLGSNSQARIAEIRVRST